MILHSEDSNTHLEIIPKDKISIGPDTFFLKGQKEKKKF